ncbi:aldo-keto reductase family 1 member A1 isoform X2 [Atheta coriaria]|uniref:aldo-keto reductase family 1 member A1 isoform X2 n=1 Tax=Dalotia coriaria TaxID=877792 RepID=UPI0031F3E3C1
MAGCIETMFYNGISTPSIGFGTWQAKDDELEQALNNALEAGYRHIDTATVYENEKVIGKVLKKWIDSGKLKRDDLFIVTKLPPCGNRPSGVATYLQRSLDDLQLDYVDMYLIHTPFAFIECGDMHPMKDGKIMLDMNTDHVATWKVMEEQVDAGKAKAIGLSNFNITQISKVLEHARIKPANLQIELHAYHQQVPLVDYAKKHGIVVTAYSPLGAPGLSKFMEDMNQKAPKMPNILDNPVVDEIAKKHNKSPAQVVLRHGVQKGLIVIPKSTNPGRLRQNLDIFDFELDENDMSKLNGLNKDARFLDFKVFPGITEHPEYPWKKE